jgi:hypothetical protein
MKKTIRWIETRIKFDGLVKFQGIEYQPSKALSPHLAYLADKKNNLEPKACPENGGQRHPGRRRGPRPGLALCSNDRPLAHPSGLELKSDVL